MKGQKINKRNAMSHEMPKYLCSNPHTLRMNTQRNLFYTTKDSEKKEILKLDKTKVPKTINKEQKFGVSIDNPMATKTDLVNRLTGTLYPNDPRSQFFQ